MFALEILNRAGHAIDALSVPGRQVQGLGSPQHSPQLGAVGSIAAAEEHAVRRAAQAEAQLVDDFLVRRSRLFVRILKLVQGRKMVQTTIWFEKSDTFLPERR